MPIPPTLRARRPLTLQACRTYPWPLSSTPRIKIPFAHMNLLSIDKLPVFLLSMNLFILLKCCFVPSHSNSHKALQKAQADASTKRAGFALADRSIIFRVLSYRRTALKES